MTRTKAAIAMARLSANGHQHQFGQRENYCCVQMPLHYPRYKKSDYEKMPEWKLDSLLKEYGLTATRDINQKRKFGMGAFLWPSQNE